MKKMFSFKCGAGVTALMLAAVLMFSGCGAKNTASNGSNYGSEEIQDQMISGEENQSQVSGGNYSAAQAANSSKTGGSGQALNGGTQTSGSTTFGSNPYANIPQSAKSKSVHVLMWRNYTPLEQKLVTGFEKKTGIKVRTTKTTENEYATKLLSLVSGNDSPDVVMIESADYPGVAMRSLQILDPTVYKLSDSFWYKPYMDVFKANGKSFAVSARGPWATEDTNYVTYYKPSVLKNSGISEDPWTLYKQGKWDWDKQKEIATKIKQKGSGYIGLSLQNQDLLMYSTGTDLVSYNGKQFKSTLSNSATTSLITKAWQQVAAFHKDGISSDWNLSAVQQGKVGLFSAIAYGMYNASTDAWFTNVPHTSADIKAVPVAGPKGSSAYTPVRVKAWGTAKNAKNPVGAAYFMRYFLDTKNCDMAGSFYNEQFREVYNTITSASAKKSIMRGEGVIDYVSAGTYGGICNDLLNSTAEQITSVLNASQGKMNTGINRANKELKKIG